MTTLSFEDSILDRSYLSSLRIDLGRRSSGQLKQPDLVSEGTQGVFGLSQFDSLSFEEAAKPRQGTSRAKSLSSQYAPIRTITRLQVFWGLSDVEMRAICGLLPSEEETVAQSLVKVFNLPDIKNRLRSLMIIRGRLSALFNGSQAAERQWLRTPWSRLQDRTPLAQLTSGDFSALVAVEWEIRELVGG